jgi:hypothetical protein
MSSSSGHVCFARGQVTPDSHWVRYEADPRADLDTMWNRIISGPTGNGTRIRLASREQISKSHSSNVICTLDYRHGLICLCSERLRPTLASIQPPAQRLLVFLPR